MGSVSAVQTTGGTVTCTETNSWIDTNQPDESCTVSNTHGSYALSAAPDEGFRFSRWERRSKSYSDNYREEDSPGEGQAGHWINDPGWGDWQVVGEGRTFTIDDYLLQSNTDYTSGSYYHSDYFCEYRAVFVKEETLYSVTTAVSPHASQAVGCAASGGGSYGHGSRCTVTATPAWNYRFDHWELSTGETPRSATYSFMVEQDVTATACFVEKTGKLLHGAGGTLLFGASGSLLFDG